MAVTRRIPVCFAALLVSVAACSTTTSPGPTADVSVEVTGGNGTFLGAVMGASLPSGYVEHEYFASGTATAYDFIDSLPDDGHWRFVPTTKAAYRTRIVVRRPTVAADASGTVVVEWLNVSGGVDAAAEYGSLVEEILRRGHTWVGVSAQLTGVEGGPILIEVPGGNGVAGLGLKGIDPARYGSLNHPGDGYAFDIFTQVARALRSGGTVLGGIRPRYLIAAGDSQSAMALTTYYDGVQPLTRAFDGFFVHSRAGAGLPLVQPGESADLSSGLFASERPMFRDDLDAPVMDLQAESDVTGLLNSYVVRQPDNARFRLWEVAGTAHADAHLLGAVASTIDCGNPINDAPMHVVAKAALRGLDVWLRTGTAPAMAPRLDVEPNMAGTPTVMRDADAIALAGIRTPPVDVPVDTLSGDASFGAGLICLLLGSTTPLTDPRIAALYTSRATYQQQYAAAVDATIAAGFALEDDRAALEGYAQPLRVLP